MIYAAAADTKLIIYDGTAAGDAVAANVICTIGIDVSLEGSTSTKAWTPCEPIKYAKGLFIVLTGAGSNCNLYYK